MKKFSVCYDKYCIARFDLACGTDERVMPDEKLGAFEMYILGMWNDGMVVTMKEYDEETEESRFILLVPDGSEQLMNYSREGGFVVQEYRKPGEGRLAYLLHFLKGMEYKGFRGYEEYDEEEEMIFGAVTVGEKTLTYGGQNLLEVNEDFKRVIDEVLKEKD